MESLDLDNVFKASVSLLAKTLKAPSSEGESCLVGFIEGTLNIKRLHSQIRKTRLVRMQEVVQYLSQEVEDGRMQIPLHFSAQQKSLYVL